VRLFFDVRISVLRLDSTKEKRRLYGKGACYRLKGRGVIHIMTHDPACGVKGNGRCEIEPLTPRSVAAPVDVMPSVCASYFAY
jgi:hypothetical protein